MSSVERKRCLIRLQDKLYIIEQLPIFSGLSSKEKRLIAANSILAEYKKGELIYKQGDAPDAFYCVVTGRVKIYIKKRSGGEDILEYLKRGKTFGIISLLTKEPHSVFSVALNDAMILKIEKDAFERMASSIPQLMFHLSQTLSRRLKGKDLAEKRIFESTIVSVYGVSGSGGATDYALSLAGALRAETKKNCILVAITKPGDDISKYLGLNIRIRPLYLRSPFFSKDEVSANVSRHSLGFDIMNLVHSPDNLLEAKYIISLISYLTNDYHYIIIDLPIHIDKTSFEVLKQSDFLHMITPSDRPGLESAAGLVEELSRSFGETAEKIKVITVECGKDSAVPFGERSAILKHNIFATISDPTDRSGVTRRIARQMGEVLVGLALGSGAAMGLAHIGVLKVLEEEKIPIDMLVGTSMGALIGAFWASGKTIKELEEIVRGYRSKLANIKLMDFTFPRRGIIKGMMVRKFLRSHLGNKTFYDLKLPFKIVACDIQTRQEVVLDKGSLVDAVLASVSVPGVFEPVQIDGKILVDGGIVNPVPTNVLSKMGAHKIIAVNTLPSPADVVRSKKKVTNIFDIIVNSVQASEYILAEMNCQNADVVMHPIVSAMDWYEFFSGEKAVKRGEEEARKFLSAIKELVSQ